MHSINEELLARMREAYGQDPHARTLTAAMAKTDIAELAFLPMEAAKLNGEFSIEIKTHGATAQERSGRCWMFAGMNLVREEIIKNCCMDEKFELSGNYLAFWDKLEKANNFLDEIITYAGEDLNSRRMQSVLRDNVSDGGWWDEFADLICKYGVVPKSAMPEVYHSGHTAKLLAMLRKLLICNAVELRKMIAAGAGEDAVSRRKEEMLTAFYKAECIAFGEPPKTFDFSFRDKEKVYHTDCGLTPMEFYEKYAKIDLTQYVNIACQPSEKKPYYKTFVIHHSGNMAGHSMKSLNLPIGEAKELVLAMLKNQEPVWFGCDSGQYGERSRGYWDPDSFDYEGLLGGVDLQLTREEALIYRESDATHAMLFVGVNIGPDGKPDRWKIENSWGSESGKNGYFVCSARYFDTYVYEFIINKKYLSEEQLAMLESEPIRIEPWEV